MAGSAALMLLVLADSLHARAAGLHRDVRCRLDRRHARRERLLALPPSSPRAAGARQCRRAARRRAVQLQPRLRDGLSAHARGRSARGAAGGWSASSRAIAGARRPEACSASRPPRSIAVRHVKRRDTCTRCGRPAPTVRFGPERPPARVPAVTGAASSATARRGRSPRCQRARRRRRRRRSTPPVPRARGRYARRA